MLIYEVNLQINTDILAEYMSWLKDHIQEILNLPGFKQAILLNEQNSEKSNNTNITIQYYLNSQENLNNYLENHAHKMRADGLNRFKNRFTATRRIFEISDIF